MEEVAEGYIFLDEDGSAQHLVEIYITWNWIPDKNYLIKVNKDISIELLKWEIITTMETKNSKLFSGLKNLTVINLRKDNKQSLPDTGLIASVIKGNDHLLIDLSSDDIWLHVNVEVPDKESIIRL
jgi:hypothetical protein